MKRAMARLCWLAALPQAAVGIVSAIPVTASLGQTSARLRVVRDVPPGQARDASNIDLRPHASESQADVVRFGVFCKKLGGISMVEGVFSADLVLTLKWNDPRAAHLARGAGVPSVTLSLDSAERRVWLPDVRLCNRNVRGVDIISSAVTVDDQGNVTKVDRLLAQLRNEFEVSAFPFDSQVFSIRLASASLMSDELQFLPLASDENISGAVPGLLNNSGFELDSIRTVVIDERDATLRKSRGEMLILASRQSASYFQSLLLPELLVLAISLSVFWFPLLGPFAMPRVATALISFLALTTLGLRTNAMLPSRGGLAWIDLFETCCQSIMLFTLFLNIFVLVVHHSFQEEELARNIDTELRKITPMVSVGIFGAVFYKRDGSGLWFLNFAINNLLTVVGLVYVGSAYWRLTSRLKEKAASDVEAGAFA